MKEIELKIPNLGEAEDTEIIEISVKKGDKLNKNDPIIVLESEKAAMEVPADVSGTIKDIYVKEGDSVKEGSVYALIEIEEIEEINQKVETPQDLPKKIEKSEEKIEKVIIDFNQINAGPAVRKIARELEIDLNKILGSGKNKLITKDDLKNHIHSGTSQKKLPYADLKSLEIYGEYKLENQSKIRKTAAKNLTKSWQIIPHVTHFEEANITKIEKQRKDLNNVSSIKITPLAYLIKATSIALEKFPLLNSSLVDEGKVMIKKYVNIGVAVSTQEGLVVPVIKNVTELKIAEIAKNILDLSAKAKNKKLMKDDISGSTFTVSSLGNIGGIGFSPIINPPEVGIIGVSRAKSIVSIENSDTVEKLVLPFSLSYDHRVINGVDAGEFMKEIKEIIEKGIY